MMQSNKYVFYRLVPFGIPDMQESQIEDRNDVGIRSAAVLLVQRNMIDYD